MLAAKAIPAVIGAFLRGIGTGIGIVAPPVKVDAVISGVTEYTVQDDADPQGLCFLTEPGKALLIAKAGVNGKIVSGVIFVIAGCGENGVEIQNPNAQGF